MSSALALQPGEDDGDGLGLEPQGVCQGSGGGLAYGEVPQDAFFRVHDWASGAGLRERMARQSR